MIAFVEMTVTFAALTALCPVPQHKNASGRGPYAVVCFVRHDGLVQHAGQRAYAGACGHCLVWRGGGRVRLLWRKHKDIRWREFFSPAMVYFLLASLAVIVLFAVRRPIFNEWDEFSFWGIGAQGRQDRESAVYL